MHRQTEKQVGYLDGQTETLRESRHRMDREGTGVFQQKKWHLAGQRGYNKKQRGQMNGQPNSLQMDCQKDQGK